jgi:hypothetical protein
MISFVFHGVWDRKRSTMSVILILVILAVFTTGIAAGAVLALIAAAIRREERAYSFTRVAPDPLSAGARIIYGAYTRSDDHAKKDLQKDPDLIDTWQSANSQIEDTYKLMGPPPSDDGAGGEDD